MNRTNNASVGTRQGFRSAPEGEFVPACSASVVVLSYNSENTIRRCLDSLFGQVTSLRFEVLVIDSGRDGTAAIVENEYPWARMIHLPRRVFPGQARNIGILHATTEIIAFLASDCVAHPQWLETRYQLHQEGFTAVGGAITNANPSSIIGWANHFMEHLYSLPSRPREEIKDKLIHNLSYKRETFRRYGLFPTHLQLGEDTVFNRRLMLNREPVIFDPRVCTGHINPTSTLDFLTHQYQHGVDFALACRRGELSFFRIPEAPFAKFLALYQPLIRYPFLRIRNSIQVVSRNQRSLLSRFVLCFPFLILGIFSAALGVTSGYYRTSCESVQGACQE